MMSVTSSPFGSRTTSKPAEALRELALRHEAMYDYNAARIRQLYWCFRIAIVLLVGEVAVWIEVLREVK